MAQLRDDHRAYAMLAELNIKPRTRYLARLRNPARRGEPSRRRSDDDHGKESV